MAFRRWHAGSGLPRDRAMKEWSSLYNATGAGVSAETRETIRTVSWSTLRRWWWAFAEDRSAGLADKGRRGRVNAVEANPEFLQTAMAAMFRNPKHVTARQIRRRLAARYPDRETPSISTIRRWMAGFRKSHAFELSAVSDPDGHRSRTMPAYGSASEAITALNEVWELDSTKADVMCADGKRYTVVAGIDIWSRRAMALVAPTSRAVAIAALLRRKLLAHGVPDCVRTDEGADYVSKHVSRAFSDLDIVHEVLPPYSPDRKPHIERFLGTMTRDLFADQPGFTGHSVADREAIRSRQSFAARRGKPDAELYRCELTAEELQARIDTWCEAVYGREPHSRLGGMSPFEKAASWTGGRRRIEDERALDILLAEPAGKGVSKVLKSGIKVDGGLYVAAELVARQGDFVQARRDPADWGRIYVFAMDGTFICLADDPGRTGVDREAVATESKRRWRARNKAARKLVRDLDKAAHPGEVADAALEYAKDEASRVRSFPAPAAAHGTPELDAAAKAAAALDREDAAREAPRREAAERDYERRMIERTKREQAFLKKLRASG